MPGWAIADDYKKNFTPKTMGNPCIMGSTTAFVLGAPLENRPCITVSTSAENREVLHGKGFIVAQNPREALHIAEKLQGEIIWNIGGGKMYAWFRKYQVIQEIHITKVQATYRGVDEIKFCSFNPDEYELDPTRTLYINKRAPKTNGDKDSGNTDDAIVEVYMHKERIKKK
jgi:dihydrofolate reductase